MKVIFLSLLLVILNCTVLQEGDNYFSIVSTNRFSSGSDEFSVSLVRLQLELGNWTIRSSFSTKSNDEINHDTADLSLFWNLFNQSSMDYYYFSNEKLIFSTITDEGRNIGCIEDEDAISSYFFQEAFNGMKSQSRDIFDSEFLSACPESDEGNVFKAYIAGQAVLVCNLSPTRILIYAENFIADVLSLGETSPVFFPILDSEADVVHVECAEIVMDDTTEATQWIAQSRSASFVSLEQINSFDPESEEDSEDPIPFFLDPSFEGSEIMLDANLRANFEAFQHKQVEGIRCLFIHGIGNTGFTNVYENYWGGTFNRTLRNFCGSFSYFNERTIELGWTSAELLEKVRSFVLSGNIPDDNVVRKTILFSHSMGGLMVAEAIRRNYFSLDLKTTYWYTSQTPFELSAVAGSALPEVCKVMTHSIILKSVRLTIDFSFSSVNSLANYCNATSFTPNTGYLTLFPAPDRIRYRDTAFLDMLEIAQRNLDGILCGSSALALPSTSSFEKFRDDVALLVMSVVWSQIDPENASENDGMVNFVSCEKGRGANFKRKPNRPNKYNFVGRPESSYYLGGMSHTSGTCRNGDSWLINSRKPCAWYIHHAKFASNQIVKASSEAASDSSWLLTSIFN